MSFSWMAWTLPTALFFLTILGLLVGMAVWEYVSPGGNPRFGVLRIETTRGDRLFISLLSAAFIHLGFLGFGDLDLWWGTLSSLVFAVFVFRFV
jgi:predicted small integral membrane protein